MDRRLAAVIVDLMVAVRSLRCAPTTPPLLRFLVVGLDRVSSAAASSFTRLCGVSLIRFFGRPGSQPAQPLNQLFAALRLGDVERCLFCPIGHPVQVSHGRAGTRRPGAGPRDMLARRRH